MRPVARGRSLTAVSILHGDPAGRAGVAAIERWSSEVWAAAGGDNQGLLAPFRKGGFPGDADIVLIGSEGTAMIAAAIDANRCTWVPRTSEIACRSASHNSGNSSATWETGQWC